MSPKEVADPVAFEGVSPILRVQDVTASVRYYVDKLGFKIDWQTPGFVSVSRGRAFLFLTEGDQGNPGSWVWIGVSDAAALFEEYRAKGAIVRHPPTNYTWAYEMQVQDLDGNILRLGSEPKDDQDIGEWLDMNGGRWIMSKDGKWTRAMST